MIKHCYEQRREAKCNFCFEWFRSESTVKNSLHLCSECIEKALNTTSYKVPSPDGSTWYQLYLFKNNIKIDACEVPEGETAKSCLLEDIDIFRDKQLKNLTQKWDEISQTISKLDSVDEEKGERYSLLFRKSLKAFASIQQQLKNQIAQEESKTANLQQLKERDANVAILITSPTKPHQKRQSRDKFTDINLSSPIKILPSFPTSKVRDQPKIGFKLDACRKKVLNLNKSGNGWKENFLTKTPSSLCPNSQKRDSKGLGSSFISKAGSSFNRSKESRLEYDAEKRARDLQFIAQDALKGKIYSHLETQSAVAPALFLVMTLKIYDAIKNTSTLNKCIELVSYDISDLDIKCYLSMLEWDFIDVLKLVKVGLTDEQFSTVVDFMQDKNVQTVVVSSNKLTERSCQVVRDKGLPRVRNLYMGRNKVKRGKAKEIIKELEQKYALYL